VAVGKHKGINSRKAIAHNAILTYEATLDARSSIYASVVVDDKVSRTNINTHIRALSHCAILKVRGTLNGAALLYGHLANEASANNGAIVTYASHRGFVLFCTLHN
jgi:hypothetical protein